MNGFRYTTPPVVKNLIIANCVMLLATTLLPFRNELIGRLALFNVESPLFHSYQVVTYMFLHGVCRTSSSICLRCGCSAVHWSTSWARSVF